MTNKKNTSTTNTNTQKKTWEREMKKGDKVAFKNANGERMVATINGFWKQGELVEKDTYTQGGQFNDFRGINLVDEHDHETSNINACQIEEYFEVLELPHEEYTTPADIKRINDELNEKAKKGLLIGIRQDKEKLMLAEPQVNGVWTLHLNEKGYITKITLF